MSMLLYGCTTWTLKKHIGEKLHKNAMIYCEQILERTNNEKTAVRPLSSHITNHPSKTNKTCGTLPEKQRRTHKRPSSWT